jgi:outer membrane protein TolC
MVTVALVLAGTTCAAQEPRPAAPGPVPLRLALGEAIERGLKANLRLLAAGTRVDEAGGTRERRLAALLPRARAEGVANLQNRNLRAFGLSFPGVPDVVGPFSNYDYRFTAEQAVLDLPSYRSWRASEKQEQASRADYQDVRDLIIRHVAGLYLGAQAAAARVEAAESRVATADELYRLAVERRAAGVATGVDVLRAEVELANARQRLLEARNAARQALLTLARQIGLSPGTPLELAEPLRFAPVPAPDAAAALPEALDARADYQALARQREALDWQQRANRGRYLPKLGVGGNFGGIGRAPGDIRATGLVQGVISWTVFDQDRKGEWLELESRARRLEHQMADLRLGIEEEIRAALLTLESASAEVEVAGQGRGLAERELALARERFEAGVAGNIEVVTAQESLARARDNYIVAVTRHADAKVALARALGATEKSYGHYLGVR